MRGLATSDDFRRARYPDEISARLLQVLIRPWQLPGIPLQLSDALLLLVRGDGRFPESISAFCAQLRRVTVFMPSTGRLSRSSRATRFRAQLEDHCHYASPRLHGMRLP